MKHFFLGKEERPGLQRFVYVTHSERFTLDEIRADSIEPETGQLWKELFKQLGTTLSYSTAAPRLKPMDGHSPTSFDSPPLISESSFFLLYIANRP